MKISCRTLAGLVGLGWMAVSCSSTGPTGPDADPPLMEVITEPTVMTRELGGVPPPSKEALETMHRSDYVLHAKAGKLTRVPVKKVLLPHAEPMTPQGGTSVDLGPDGTVYVRQANKLCTSTDGGLTWSAREVKAPSGFEIHQTGRWKVLSDGTFLCVAVATGKDERAPAEVWTSQDQGQSWERTAQIALDLKMPGTGTPYDERYCHRGLDRLQDDTLLWTIDVRSDADPETGLPRQHGLFLFRSGDKGRTWQGPTLMWDWGSEGSATRLPSGAILATMRYQRDKHPQDSAEIVNHMGAYPRTPKNLGFKNVFLVNSSDDGATWTRPRMLTTVYGQTFGYPAVQSDGTAVVVHDTRYGPGPPGSRAMVSRDEGQTWEDEVYYLDSTNFTGSYSASLVLEDDTILTIAASSVGGSWDAVRDKTDLYAIRWKPVKDGQWAQ